MVTVLSRRTVRRVGDLMVALNQEGLELRRLRSRSSYFVTWDELEQEYLLDTKTGPEAFERPLPIRWLPVVGVKVWVKPKEVVYCGEVVKVLAGLGEEIVVVRLRRSKKFRDIQVLLSQCRPMG
jgi:hypothetical protein